jgi:hypothetical protein
VTTINALRLMLERQRLKPTNQAHRLNGTTTLMWHVDNNDNRYVLLSDSPKGEDFLMLARDEKKVEACVKSESDEIVQWVARQVKKLASTKI